MAAAGGLWVILGGRLRMNTKAAIWGAFFFPLRAASCVYATCDVSADTKDASRHAPAYHVQVGIRDVIPT